MLKINLQLFAHKKGMGSTRNGRDSESKRLARSGRTASLSLRETSLSSSAARTSTPATTLPWFR